MIPVILFLSMNIPVVITAFLLSSRIFKTRSFSDFLINWFILYFSQIVLTEIILGATNSLYLKNIILLNIAILSMVYFFLRKKKSDFSFAFKKEALAEILTDKVSLFVISIILGYGIVKVFINLINPPFGWDNLNYHFTFPVEWLKNGNLKNPITVFCDPSPPYYPINGSLFFLWFIFPFKNVFLADLGQVPFFVLSFLAIYSISRKLSLTRRYSMYTAGLFLIMPNVFKQLEIAYVDMMVCGLFLAGLNYIFLISKKVSYKNVILFSASLGLFIGVKTLALAYSSLLIFPFLCKIARERRKFLLILLLFIIFISILGGFSYIRNYLDTSNPLYPFDFSLFGKTIFKGVMDKATYGAHFKLEDYALSKLLFHEGLGGQAIVFMFLPIFLTLPFVLLKKRKTFDFNLGYFLVLPILIYLIYRFIIPLANTRYLYPFLGVGMVVGFYFVNLIGIKNIVVKVFVTLCALASMFELASSEELVAGTLTTFILFFSLIFLIRRVKFRINKKIIVLIGLFFVLLLGFLNKYYVENEHKNYMKMEDYSGFWPEATRAWDWINKNTDGANIAYAGRPVPFPLYGKNFKNNVYYVSVNDTEPAKLHYFPNSYYKWGYDFSSMHDNFKQEGNYRSNPDHSVWLGNLLKKDTDYLFVYSLHQTKEVVFPLEDNWVKKNPKKFSLVFSNKTIHIYKVFK